ncbi:MAG: hypothetical protein IKK45_05020 [Akkermansia sp.]|nr:hypothetical protein [Akkermansia sp.]
MKRQLIQTALLVSSTVFLSSCFEETPTPENSGTPAAPEQAAQPVVPTQPTDEEILKLITEQLSIPAYLAPGTLECEEPTPQPDGSITLTAKITLAVQEDMFTKEAAPAELNKEREAVNEAANQSMKPESVYLLQIGAPTNMITDEDRKAKPLPENLQGALNELKELADSAVYTKTVSAGEEVSATISFTAVYKDGAWQYSGISMEKSALQQLENYSTQSALPQDAPVLTPEFTENRKNLIREKIAAFNQLADPYIKSREEAARATLTENQAKAEEEARRMTEQAAAEEAARQEWVNLCVQALTDGKLFAGEWKRDNKFGELSLQIDTAKQFDNSIQFVGTIYDTKLPEACLDIAGRCDLTPTENGAQVDITIYDGQYDPDQPTAEVYDAKDGLLVLHLDKEGKLSGIMSCASWSGTPEKAFQINMSPKAAEKKSSRRR